MAEHSALTVAAQQIKSKEESVKNQLTVLEKAEKELASVECSLTKELDESLCDVQRRFLLLRESVNEKEAECCFKIREAAEKRMKTIKTWREKKSEVGALATNVSQY